MSLVKRIKLAFLIRRARHLYLQLYYRNGSYFCGQTLQGFTTDRSRIQLETELILTMEKIKLLDPTAPRLSFNTEEVQNGIIS